MRKHLVYTFKVLLLAAAYFITGKLSLLLAIPPGFATPVWPAAGVALAGVLIWGYRYLPGVFLGSFATNLLIASQGGADIVLLSSLLPASGIGLGAVFQSAFSCWMIRRVCKMPSILDNPKHLISIFLYGGIIGCLVNALIGPLVLFISGIIPAGIYLVSAFTWWAGDAIGVILFAPLLLLLANKNVSTTRKSIVGLPLLLFASIVVVIFMSVRESGHAIQVKEFEKKTIVYTESIKQKIRVAQEILESVRRLYVTSGVITRKQFSTFTQDILIEHDFIKALEWVPRVSYAEKNDYERLAHKEGYVNFSIMERVGGQLLPVSRRHEYFPVYFIEPYLGNERAFGFDLGSDQERLSALRWAWSNEKQAATGKISLVQESETQSGFLLFEPVYQTKSVTEYDNVYGLRGFVLGVFNTGALINIALKNIRQDDIHLQIKDISEETDVLLYGSKNTAAPFSYTVILNVANRQWVLEFTPSAMSLLQNQGFDLWGLLLGGLLFSAIFGAFLMIISSKTEHIQSEVVQESDKVESTEFIFYPGKATNICGVLTALLGLTVLFGWYTHTEAFIQIHSSFVPMQYNTALGFMLSGIGIVLLISERLKLAVLCGSLIALLGLLTLVQYVFGVNLSIDQLFMEHYITTKASHPGRMAPNTALCFTLTGFMLIIPLLTRNPLVLRVLSSAVLVLGMVAVVGYALTVEAAYGWMNLTRMAVHTAVGFVVIGVGFFTYSLSGKVFHATTISTLWPSGLAVSIIMMLTVALHQKIIDQEQRSVQALVNKELELIQSGLSDGIKSAVIALRRMGQRWEVSAGSPKQQWDEDARHYVEDFSALTTVEWVDSSYHVRWIEPLQGNEKAMGLNIAFNQERKDALDGAAEKHKITMTPPLDLVQGYRAAIIYIPIYVRNKFDGFIVGIFNTDILLNNILKHDQMELLSIVIKDGEKNVFQNSNVAPINSVYTTQKEIDLFNRNWLVKVAPKSEFISAHQSSLPNITLLAGIMFSLLVGVAIYASILSNRRSNLLHQKEEKLSHISERLRLILDNAGEGVYGLDLNGYTTFANNAAVEMLGYSLEEMVNKSQHELIHHHYPDGTLYHKEDCNIYAAIKDGKVHSTDQEVFWKKDGSALPIEYTSRPIRDKKHKISGVVVVFKDITERKQAEQEREQLVENLTLSNEELQRFAYVCSHDLQEPIRMVQSFGELLAEKLENNPDKEIHHYLNYITSGAENARGLVKGILDYSRIHKEGLPKEEIVLAEIMHQIRDALTLTLTERCAKVNWEKLPTIFGVRSQIYQLLYNLINNGIKFNKSKIPQVDVSATEEKDTWSIHVKDNGIGIAPEYHQKVFNLFSRLNNKEQYPGTGIGLATCLKIVNRAGGNIEVVSEVNQGCQFIIYWPKQ